MSSLLTSLQQKRWNLFVKPPLNVSGDATQSYINNSAGQVVWKETSYGTSFYNSTTNSFYVWSYGKHRLLRNSKIRIEAIMHPIYYAVHATYGRVYNLGLVNYATPVFTILSPQEAYKALNVSYAINGLELKLFGLHDFTDYFGADNEIRASRTLIARIDETNTRYAEDILSTTVPATKVVQFVTLTEDCEGSEFDAFQIMMLPRTTGCNNDVYVAGGWSYTLVLAIELRISIICEGFARDQSAQLNWQTPSKNLVSGITFQKPTPTGGTLKAALRQEVFPILTPNTGTTPPAVFTRMTGLVPPLSKQSITCQQVYLAGPQNLPDDYEIADYKDDLDTFIG